MSSRVIKCHQEYFEKSVLEFYKYFGNNYVGHKTETRVQVEPVKRGCRPAGCVPEFVMKDIMTEPIFPIRYWNVYTRVEAGLSRTNNFTEYWHSAFNKILIKHP